MLGTANVSVNSPYPYVAYGEVIGDINRHVRGGKSMSTENSGQGMETRGVFGSKNLDQNLECELEGSVWSGLRKVPGCLSRLILYRPSLIYNPVTQAFFQILTSTLKFPVSGPLHMLFPLHLKLPSLPLVNSFRRLLNCYFIRKAFSDSPSSTIELLIQSSHHIHSLYSCGYLIHVFFLH